MIHDFDTARWLVGEIAAVSAQSTSVSDPAFGETGDADHAVAVLRFENGALGVIDNSRLAGYGYECSVELIGSDGTIRIVEDQRGSFSWLAGGARVTRFPIDHIERHGPAYAAELNAFARAIREGHSSPVPGRDGLAAFRVSDAAVRSLEEHRPVSVIAGQPEVGTATGA
jgi:myo-inositol 2-dehydrogenase/D-chiro-inositol 1-dehydrogenase